MFLAYVGATAAAVLVGLPLTVRFGVTGAVIGVLLSSVATAVIAAILLVRDVREYGGA